MPRFEKSEGVITDTKTGFQWYSETKKFSGNHYEAEKWVKALSDGGGWRLPTVKELREIYIKNGKNGLDPVFEMTGWWVWSSEIIEGCAGLFTFDSGNVYWLDRANTYADGRLFAITE